MKTRKHGVYTTPDFDVEVVITEAGFALSVEGEGFEEYPETSL